MRVAVLCEFSGAVRDAFIARGHDAVSCDLLPCETPGPHIQGDCLKQDWTGYDLVIAHPPCTYLCSSGLHWNKRRPDRQQKTEQALDFVRAIMQLPVPRLCIENPVGCISTRIGKPQQTIQPWMFGHPESKATCLWLRGLPLLVPTEILSRNGARWDNQTASGQNKLAPGPNRWALRSKTYAGIAAAMADQWGKLSNEFAFG